MHIIVNKEEMLISTAQAEKGVVRPLDFAENCEQCGSNLAISSKVKMEKVVCNCGKEYMIHGITQTPANAGEETDMAKDKTETTPTKAKKAKDDFAPKKKAKADDFAPKAKKEPKEKGPREGSITNAELIRDETWGGKIREGSICATIIPFFKKATVPGKVLDKMIAAYNENHKISASAKKNPKAYVLWHVLYLLRKGALVKA